MEFTLSTQRDLSHYHHSLEVVEQYLLSKLDRINERETSDPKLGQEIYLLKHQRELSRLVEGKIVPKLLKDIDFILEKGWGKEISKADFYHVHVCGKHKNYMFSLDEILSEDNVRLLYHTLETLFLTPDHANRNIISSLKLPPTLMPIHLNCIWGKGADYNMRGPGQIAIHSSDLGLAEYFKIEFEESSDGCCRLKNGSRLNMTGVLPSLLPHIRIENGTIEFNGRTIGQNETFLDLLLHA